MEEQKTGLQPYFEGSAAPPPERVTVALEMDADVLEWFKAQPLDWQREINNAARFVMDMSSQPVPPIEVYEADFFETAGRTRPATPTGSSTISFPDADILPAHGRDQPPCRMSLPRRRPGNSPSH